MKTATLLALLGLTSAATEEETQVLPTWTRKNLVYCKSGMDQLRDNTLDHVRDLDDTVEERNVQAKIWTWFSIMEHQCEYSDTKFHCSTAQ